MLRVQHLIHQAVLSRQEYSRPPRSIERILVIFAEAIVHTTPKYELTTFNQDGLLSGLKDQRDVPL